MEGGEFVLLGPITCARDKGQKRIALMEVFLRNLVHIYAKLEENNSERLRRQAWYTDSESPPVYQF